MNESRRGQRGKAADGKVPRAVLAVELSRPILHRYNAANISTMRQLTEIVRYGWRTDLTPSSRCVMSTDSAVPLPSRFDVSPYKSDGGSSLAGSLQLFSILCSVAILVGLIVSFISQWQYFIIVFPLLMSLAIGWVGAKTIERYKMRQPWICGIAGVAAGLLCCLTMHYADYQRLKSQMADVPAQIRDFARRPDQVGARNDQPPQDVADLIRQFGANPKFFAALRVNSFWDYVKFRADEGVTIRKVGNGEKGMNLGYEGSFVYWGLEAFLLAAMALVMMRDAASRPFCTDCDLWKTETTLMETTCAPKPIVAAIRQGDLDTLEKVLTSIDSKRCKDGQSTRISTCVCPNCETEQTVEVKVSKVVIYGKRPNVSTLAQISYPGESLAAITSLARRVQYSRS